MFFFLDTLDPVELNVIYIVFFVVIYIKKIKKDPVKKKQIIQW